MSRCLQGSDSPPARASLFPIEAGVRLAQSLGFWGVRSAQAWSWALARLWAPLASAPTIHIEFGEEVAHPGRLVGRRTARQRLARADS